MQRKAMAVWQGGLKDGKGTLTTESGILSKTQYSFSTRFEQGKGTNPEELIAAAHAGCFSMALSAELGKANMTADTIQTNAAVVMEKLESGWAITSVHLDMTAVIENPDEEAFRRAAESAKANCPVSKLLKAKITMDARLQPK